MHLTSTDLDEVDDLDGLPVWTCAGGDDLLPGLRAVARLGVGHRTETWLVWSVELWHPVVVKVARPHQLSHPRAARTLLREAEALAPPGHPALPRLLAARFDDVPHLVLEYVDGTCLADLIDDDGPMTSEDVAMLGARLVPPLLHLHQRGLAHLDVKSENVMVRHDEPVLLDCGSSRALGRHQPTGHPVGTEGYAAPEMEACAPVAGTMDLFGLGTVLAEGLTGRPYPEVTELPDTPVTPVVRSLLAADPADRPEPQALLAGLAACCAEEPWPVRLLVGAGPGPGRREDCPSV